MYNKKITEEYHQFWLPEYSGQPVEIYCKHRDKVFARITPCGYLEVFSGCWYVGDNSGCAEAALVRSVLFEMYHQQHGHKYYQRKDINVIYCNIMKSFKVDYFVRKTCYFKSVCYSVWDKFNRKY